MLQIGCICQYNISIPNNHRFFIIMRVIETKMNKTIRRKGNFSNGNTSVQTTSFFNNDVYCEESKVFLHGNHIATVTRNSIYLFDGGWQSNTTKSRLNALLNEFSYGARVFAKNFEWFVGYKNNTEEFANGFELAL